MGRFRGLIWDIDGTLLDSNDAHAQAWRQALAENGHPVPFERIRCLVGMGADHLLPEAAGIAADSPLGERIRQRRRAIFAETYLPWLKPVFGGRALVETCRSRGFRMIVASSADRDELQQLLERAEVADLFPLRVGKTDQLESKPSPDIVCRALKCLELEPGECLMLGDTPYDIAAADRQGVATVAFESGGWSRVSLGGAIAVYRDPADLLERFEPSVLGEDEPVRRAANGT